MPRNDGDEIPTERTNAVNHWLAVAFTTPLLQSKLLLCCLLVCVTSLRHCVCVPLALFVLALLHRTPLHVATRRRYGSTTRYVCGS